MCTWQIFIFTQNDRMHWAGSMNPCFILCDDGLHEVWPLVCSVQYVRSDFYAKLFLLLHQHFRKKFCQHSPHTWDGMHWILCLFPLCEQFLRLLHNSFQWLFAELLNRYLILVCGLSAWVCLALYWSVAMSEVFVQLFNLSFAYDIITKSLLNHLGGLSLSITKLLTKLNTVHLPQHIQWKHLLTSAP